MPNDADSDWLSPHEPMTPADRHAAMLEQDPGCYRFEAPEENAQPFADMVSATCEPPTTPEAVIRDAAGRALALCTPDAAGWMFTALGVKRLAIEVGAVDMAGAA